MSEITTDSPDSETTGPASAAEGFGQPLPHKKWTDTLTRKVLPLLLIMSLGLAAFVLLFWALGDKYLWQDEAQTAVLATRMLRFGKPLAYDGVNLIGIDDFRRERAEPIEPRSRSAAGEVSYYVRNHFIKADTSWTFHPWGQFVVAAISIKLLGPTTLAARLPFALAGLITVLLLYRLALVYCASRRIATVAVVLLILNAYWILHERQSRYYSLSSLFLVSTLLCYLRWQREGRYGMAAFVISAWCWFQVDYGTVVPVLLILFADAFIAQWRTPGRTFVAATILTAAVGPFVSYYELGTRVGVRGTTLGQRFLLNLLNTNEYIIPLVVLAAALLLLVWRWQGLASLERRLVAVSCGVLSALVIWVPIMESSPFLRYTIMEAPIACLITAWFVVRVVPKGWGMAVLPATVVLALTPWFSMPLHLLVSRPAWYGPGARFVRPELRRLEREVFENPPDVNRDVVEWLRDNAAPTDEILINYEDMPLMYYLPNPIRGGSATFRVEDDSRTRPRFLVLRPNIPFMDRPTFKAEGLRYQWIQEPTSIPSVMWGNNPDPTSLDTRRDTSYVVILRRVDDSN